MHAFSNNSQFYDETQGPFGEKIELTFYDNNKTITLVQNESFFLQ